MKKTLPLAAFAAAALAVGGLGLAVSQPALAQWPGTLDRGGGDRIQPDDRLNRTTVSIRVVPVGDFCVRAVEAIGYDPRLNQRLYRIRFDSGAMASLGVTAFENAFAGARTEADAVRALSAARVDAEPFRRGPGQC